MTAGYVPCRGCTACCRQGLEIVPAASTFPYEVDINGRMAKKEDGSCFYLGESGCTIHDDRPQECRKFDCRDVARAFTAEELAAALKNPGLPFHDVLKAGAERMKE